MVFLWFLSGTSFDFMADTICKSIGRAVIILLGRVRSMKMWKNGPGIFIQNMQENVMEKEQLSKTYDICFFDLDGTIIDSSPGITNSVMYALKKFGIEETDREKLYQFIGPPLTDSFARFYGFDEKKSWLGVEYYREYYQDTGIFECSVYEGFEESLKALKAAGKRLFVATSKPEVYARRIIEHFGLEKYFEYVAGMELDGGRGTKAEVIEYLIDTCHVTDKHRILMIGDREHDVLGAKKEGLDCMGVLYGFGSRGELENAGAVCIAETPEEITKIIVK